MKRRIILADDHLVVRQGLREILGRREDLEVVAEASDGLAVEQLVRSTLADLLIMDIGLPLRRGIAVLERLRAEGYGLPVLFFSMYPPAQYAAFAKKAGAQGFIGKEASADELLQAVDKVLSGRCSFAEDATDLRKSSQTTDRFGSLSNRERQVFLGLLAGTKLHDLAQSLGVSTKTLSTYRTRLLSKLGVQSNAELVALAILHGHQ